MEASEQRLEQSLLQKQTHAVEVDDGMTDVQHIHPKNAADDCTALLPYEIWQCSYADFVRRHLEVADGQIVVLSSL